MRVARERAHLPFDAHAKCHGKAASYMRLSCVEGVTRAYLSLCIVHGTNSYKIIKTLTPRAQPHTALASPGAFLSQ